MIKISRRTDSLKREQAFLRALQSINFGKYAQRVVESCAEKRRINDRIRTKSLARVQTIVFD